MISSSESSLNKMSAATCHREVDFDSPANEWEVTANAGLPFGDFYLMWDQDCIESDHQSESQRLPQDSRSSRAEQIRLPIVDDQPVFQEGLSLILASQSDMLVIGNATTFSGAIEQFRRHKPNVTLLNHCLQGATGSGMQILTTLKSEFPGACIIVLTTAEGDVEIQRAFRAGAAFYVLKTTRKSELPVVAQAQGSAVVFTSDGKLQIPKGFRRWVFVGAPLTPNALNGGKANFPEFRGPGSADGFPGIDAMVKDSKRSANTNKWSFFTFGHQVPPYSPSAGVTPAAQCASCDIAGVAKTGHGCVQYYPLLRAEL